LGHRRDLVKIPRRKCCIPQEYEGPGEIVGNFPGIIRGPLWQVYLTNSRGSGKKRGGLLETSVVQGVSGTVRLIGLSAGLAFPENADYPDSVATGVVFSGRRHGDVLFARLPLGGHSDFLATRHRTLEEICVFVKQSGAWKTD
jgi:hypothetical protein